MSMFEKIKRAGVEFFSGEPTEQQVYADELSRLEEDLEEKYVQRDQLIYEYGRLIYTHQLINLEDPRIKQKLAVEDAAKVGEMVITLSVIEQEIASLQKRVDVYHNKKRCATCGREEELTTKFCPDCGTKFPIEQQKVASSNVGAILVTCVKCSHSNDITAKYCNLCGHDLSS